ncbi:MAG: RluA family pseudouridine synthase [Pseudomonadota bacterium]
MNDQPQKKFSLALTIDAASAGTACDILAARSGLSKLQVKDAMLKGAVRLIQGRQQRVLRRAKAELKPGDRVELHYDAAILALDPPRAACLADEQRYSLWHKPPGLLTQGSLYGDHCSLLRQAEKHFTPPRAALPVHRLDREACGLVLIAHDRESAAKLSQLFQDKAIAKFYQVKATGRFAAPRGDIEQALDGKPARTEYEVLDYDPETDISTLRVQLHTGRKHQIRRHLDAIGHPVLGDPAYGSGNKHPAGLQLVAVELAFTCPLTGRPRHYRLPAEYFPGDHSAAAA